MLRIIQYIPGAVQTKNWGGGAGNTTKKYWLLGRNIKGRN